MSQTIAQVDPIALRQKLQKLGIGPGLPMSQTFAEDAVREAFKWGQIPEVPRPLERCIPEGCPELRLEPAELAYCLHNWAALWQVPA